MNLTNYAYIFFKNHFQVQKENSFKNLKRPFIIFPGTLKGNVLMANRESQFYGKRFQHDCVCACIKDDAEFRKVASAKLISLPRTRWIHVRLEMLNITWRVNKQFSFLIKLKINWQLFVCVCVCVNDSKGDLKSVGSG